MSSRTLGGIALALFNSCVFKSAINIRAIPIAVGGIAKATGERRQELLSDSHSSASAPTIPVEAPELSVEIRNISDKCVVPASNDAQSFRGFCNFWRWFDTGAR
jgi:hypothetical protein